MLPFLECAPWFVVSFHHRTRKSNLTMHPSVKMQIHKTLSSLKSFLLGLRIEPICPTAVDQSALAQPEQREGMLFGCNTDVS